MHASIKRTFLKLERQKAEMLGETAAWSAAGLRFRPEPGSWSALEVLDHVVKVEINVMDAARHNLPEGHPIGFKDRLGGLMVNAVMRSPKRVKVPASARMVLPEITADPALVIRRWDESRQAMAKCLDSVAPNQLVPGVFRHPIGGWMTLPRTLAFLSAHLRHHAYQIKRLKQAARGL